MSVQTDNLLNLVEPYGLSTDESKIYLHLLRHGFLTALELSRQLKIGRTKVYRLLDKLKEKQLVEYQVHTRGMKFGATHPRKLEQIVAQQENEIESLKQTLPSLVDQLTNLIPQTEDKGKVLYYEGMSGLEQVSYNITRAQDQVRVFEMEHMADFIEQDLAEEIRRKLVEKQILNRDLTNKKKFAGFTQVEEMVEHYSQFRYIEPVKLEIKFETLIYNDVYATYTYRDDQIFCVEIYNQQLAQMQKQLFDFIWEQAQPMEFINKQGAARIR
jgi:sugar-specific transcriptional regulator TrmB